MDSKDSPGSGAPPAPEEPLTESLGGPPPSTGESTRWPPSAGEVLGGRYLLEAELGRGGWGVVFRAHDRVADATVAIKVLRHRAGSAQARDALRRELRAARSIVHPGVVRTHDLIDVEGQLALSMELVEGETLAERLRRAGPLPADALDRLADELAQALGAAHRCGIVHRDLKPSNVLLRATDGRALVSDFGVARLESAGEPGAARVGTPSYMAPEQAGRGEASPASDVYALGLLLWEAATGGRPSGESAEGLAARLRNARPEVSPRLARTVARCLRPEPADRFPSGEAIAAALSGGGGRRRLALALAASVTAASAATAAFATLADRAPEPTRWLPEFKSWSSEDENLGCLDVSPDGDRVVVSSTRQGGHWDIWLTEPRTATWRRLTDDPAIDHQPVFARGGRTVVFSSLLGERSALWRIDLDGPGRRTPLVEARGLSAVVPPGDSLLYNRAGPTWALLDLASGASRDVVQVDALVRDVVVHPSGRQAAFVVFAQARLSLALADLGSGVVRTVPTDGLGPEHVAFVPGQPALVAALGRGDSHGLWKLFLDGRPAAQLTAATDGQHLCPRVTPDGRRVFFMHDRSRGTLYARAPADRDWTALTPDVRSYVEPSLDALGRRLAYVHSTNAISGDLWVAEPPRGGSARRLGVGDVVFAAIAPDGEEVAAFARRGAGQALLLVPIGRGELRVLAEPLSTPCGPPAVSPDGRLIAAGYAGGRPGLYLYPRDGSAPRELVRQAVCRPQFSPRGDLLAYARFSGPGTGEVEILELATGAVRAVTTANGLATLSPTWHPDGRSLYVGRLEARELARVSTADGREVERLPFPEGLPEGLAVGPSGELIIVSTVGQARLMSLENLASGP